MGADGAIINELIFYFMTVKTGNQLTKVIDTDLHLEAVCSFAVRTHHHAGVVDEDVESGLSCRRTQWTGCGFNRLVCWDL